MARDIYDKSTEGQNLAIVGRSVDGGLSFSPKQPFLTNGDRLKVSRSRTLLATRNAYDDIPLLFSSVENVNGSINYIGDQDAVDLQIGTAAGDKLYYSTNEYFHYRSYSESQFGLGTIFPEFQSGQRVRIGSFYEENGIFFERDENGSLYIVRRSKASGAIVEERVEQADWNTNTFLTNEATTYSGNNPCGQVLDLSRIQMVKTGFMWYGAGTAWLGFEIGGLIHIAHRFEAGNRLSEPIFGEPTVPIRYEIENVSSVSSVSRIRKFGASATSETGDEKDIGSFFTADRGSSFIEATTTLQRIFTLRPAGTFKGKTNRSKINPLKINLFVSGNASVRFVFARNVPVLNIPTWQSAHNTSAAEYSLDATGVSIGGANGEPEKTVIVPAAGSRSAETSSNELNNRVPLVRKADGSDGFNFSIFAQTFAGTSDVWAGVDWKEIQ